MKKTKEKLNLFELSNSEKLVFHNLNTRNYWSNKFKLIQENLESSDKGNIECEGKNPIPNNWEMLHGIKLYDWQKNCVKQWSENKKGTIKVVTGAGKTILAFAIIEALQKLDINLKVAIIVPTIVLQNQWYEELLKLSNLPENSIGLIGGGKTDTFDESCKILVGVLKTASKKLPEIVKNSGVKDNLLLIADECHRAGSKEMSKIFSTNRAYNLGLSATPERDDWDEDTESLSNEKKAYSETILGKELGPIIYEMTLSEAFKMGILPPYEIRHYGLLLNNNERAAYDQVSRLINDLIKDMGQSPGGKKTPKSSNNFMGWCQKWPKRKMMKSAVRLGYLFQKQTKEKCFSTTLNRGRLQF